MTDQFYIDPEMQPALERMKARMAARTPMSEVPVADMRVRANEDFAPLNANPPPLALVEERMVEGAFGPRKVRLYDALGERQNAPSLIYFHGGGWIIGDLNTEDAKLRRLAHHSQVRIVSVDYVLAPEHKFPDPVEDCVAAARHIHERSDEFGLDPARLAIGGASAGANLALSTALSLRDSGQSWLRFMLLFYGVFDMDSQAPSRKLFSEDYGLGAEAMEFFYSLYLHGADERAHPLASPLRADLAALPPAFINAAALDVLRDDSRALADKMRQAGGSVEFLETPGVTHGYTLLAHEVSAAQRALEASAHALRSALS